MELKDIHKIFSALSSDVRRKILAYLSATDMTAGEIAERFHISRPSLSKHLSILENADLIVSEKKGQFVHYSLMEDNLFNPLNTFMHEVCPNGKTYIRESRSKARAKMQTKKSA